MRKAAIILAVVVLASCIGTVAKATTWETDFEGVVFPGVGPGQLPWYFIDYVLPTTYYQSYMIGGAPGQRAINMVDNSGGTDGKQARIQREQLDSGPYPSTMHLRFMIPAANPDDAAGIQFCDDLTNGDINGRMRWGWYRSGTSGESSYMHLGRGSVTSGSTDFPAPQNQWTEVWMTLDKVASPQWKLWIESGGSWTLHSSGTLDTSGTGASYVGMSAKTTGQMDIDFMRYTTAGAFAPDDPNRPMPPADTNSIGQAKTTFTPGYPVNFTNKMVTNSWLVQQDTGGLFTNFLYIQDDERDAGVKVARTIALPSDQTPVGARVNTPGYIWNDTLNETEVMADAVTVATPAPSPVVLPVPLYVNGKAVGGGRFGMQIPQPDTSTGLNNAGLRVRVFGLITGIGAWDTTYISSDSSGWRSYYVDDGSGAPNDSLSIYGDPPLPGIKVRLPNPDLEVGAYVAVSGSVGYELDQVGTCGILPVVRAQSNDDITPF